MGRIIRDGAGVYEVVDEGRGIVKEADFGTSVVAEMEAGLPAAFNIMNWFYKIFLKGYIAIRNKVVPKEDLETILLREEEKKKKQFGGGMFGAFLALMFTTFWITEVSFQIIVALLKKGIAKIKTIVQSKKENE